MLWFVRQSLVLLVLAWVLGLATGFLLFGRRRGWAEPVTDVIPVIALDDADPDADPDAAWVDEGWVAADAEAGLRGTLEDVPAERAWTPVGADWDPVPAHHDYADPVWAAEAGITDDLLAARADAAAVTPPAPAPAAAPATPPAAAPVAGPAVQPVVPRPSTPEPAVARPAPRVFPDGGDDLTRIDGVTTEIAAALHASGLRSFTAVSRATTDDLRAALSATGLAPTFKAAYWPLIAADLARASLAAAEQPAVTVPADGGVPGGDDAPGTVADDRADDVRTAAEPFASPAGSPVASPVAGPVAGPAAGSVSEHVTADEPADAQPGTVDVTDAASAPVDVTDAAVAAPDGLGGYRLDDLERIEGITLKIAVALRDAGITTYADLADAPHAQLRQALTAAGLRIAPTLQTWGAQARRLAAETDAALAARITAGGTGARL